MHSVVRSKPRTYFASRSNAVSKRSNGSSPKVPVDTTRGPWYTFGVGTTTTADAHHHAAEGATTRVLGRLVSGRRARRFYDPTTATATWILLVPVLLTMATSALSFLAGFVLGYGRASRVVLAAAKRMQDIIHAPPPPIDVVRCWRFAHRVGLRTTALRFVWITDPDEDGYSHSGTAYLDHQRAEVNLHVASSEADAAITAVHELVHIQRDNGRHDRPYFRELTKVWRRIGAPIREDQWFDGATAVHVLETGLMGWVAKELRAVPPTKVRWVRGARSVLR